MIDRYTGTSDEQPVTCRLCGREFVALGGHLGPAHGMTTKEYRRRFPGAATMALSMRADARERLILLRGGSFDDHVGGVKLPSTCVNGHWMTPANTYRNPAGYRACRKCHKKGERNWKKRQQRELCACGCGKQVKTPRAKWRRGHNPKTVRTAA